MLKMDALKAYPYVVGSHGVDFSSLSDCIGRDEIPLPSGSGSALWGWAGVGKKVMSVGVYDRNTGVGVSQKRMVGEVHEGMVSFSIVTRPWDGERLGPRHPDLIAPLFMICFLDWVRELGVQVQKLEFTWDPWSYNYWQFWTGVRDRGLDYESAASATWSGNMANELGFTTKKYLDCFEDGRVWGVWTK